MLTRIVGGTGAGRRMHRRSVPRTMWTCAHGHRNHGFAATCLAFGCREKRPAGS
jgi:hypothetical protein